VKRIVVDEWVVLGQVAVAAPISLHLVDHRGSFRDQDQEHPGKISIRGKIRFGDFVFPCPRLAVDHWDLSALGPCAEPTAETSGHAPQMVVVQTVVGPLESPPPATKASARLQRRTIGPQDETVHTIIRAIKKVCVIFGEVIRRCHGILQAMGAWWMSYTIQTPFFNCL
jgi:hypothetical protein